VFVTAVKPDAAAVTAKGVTLSGVDALAKLLLLRHELDKRDGLETSTMISGYPGSPLGTVDLTIDNLGAALDEHRIVHRPGLNEELAMATVWGSQMGMAVPYRRGVDGVVGAWYGKGPGLDRSGDAIKHGNAMGAGPNGGVVLFCGDDPASKSSTLACDSQYTFEDACMPVLAPGDQQDVLDLGVHAFRMSRYSGCWVGMKIVTAVADGVGTIDLDLARHAPVDPEGVVINGQPWHHHPLRTVGPHAVPDQEALVVERRLTAAKAYARHNNLDRVVGAAPGARLGIVCSGKTYFDVVQAFADAGVALDELGSLGVRILKLGMTYPLVEDTILEFAASVDELVVIEEKRAFVETQLRSLLHEAGSRIPVQGKRDRLGAPLVSAVGELGAASVGAALARVLPELASRTTTQRGVLPMLTLPPRPPGFCSGCPHNRSTVFPDDALVGGGVGCHGIMYFEARHTGMTALPPTPMGAEGVPWIGLAPFVDEKHLIQNLGDGTLSHSGTLAIRASVAAGSNVTFKILYNAAVAMTGGQDVVGLMDIPSMTRALEAEGVRRIVVCSEQPKRFGRRAKWARGVTVLHRDKLEDVQAELREVDGVSVIIYDQQCAAEARRLRKRGLQVEPAQRVVINQDVCEGCGDCGAKSNCLSVLPIETEFGTKRTIHDPSCNRDYTCLEGDCPSFVTLTPAKHRWFRKTKSVSKPHLSTAELPVGELPTPQAPQVSSQYGMYFTGIGGTGVVTANRIAAAAAESAGFVVGGVDQTGLSQKAGAVVSHLHFARDRAALGAATISPTGADLYLSGDILQAAGPTHLEKVRPGHTVAVIDSTLTPTSAMLQAGIALPDLAELRAAITERVGSGRLLFLDSKAIAEHLLGNHLLANVVLVGAAYQLGGLPVSPEDIETAMRAQGKAAESNRLAFTWGRWAVHAPETVEAALLAAAPTKRGGFEPSAAATALAENLLSTLPFVPPELGELLRRRTAQVIDYDNEKRAWRYVSLVGEAMQRDSEAQGWELTRAVVEAWFKLLTYKDEYEVARLHLAADYDAAAREVGIEGPYTVKYHLHPPALRRMGLKHKLAWGAPFRASFHVLRPMKRLRGSGLDVFGHDPDRKLERALIEEFDALVVGGADQPYATQVAIARGVLNIKGYAEIKERAAEAWRVEVKRLLGPSS
jgi:indolepyruvate ferredoxin oxidoreductase